MDFFASYKQKFVSFTRIGLLTYNKILIMLSVLNIIQSQICSQSCQFLCISYMFLLRVNSHFNVTLFCALNTKSHLLLFSTLQLHCLFLSKNHNSFSHVFHIFKLIGVKTFDIPIVGLVGISSFLYFFGSSFRFL